MNTTDYLKTVISGKQRNSNLYILLFVGIVSAFGPFVTDFYLPALPELGDYFHTSASLVQLSLTYSMVGLAVGQLIAGPLSDRYGRKLPLVHIPEHIRSPSKITGCSTFFPEHTRSLQA